MRKVFLVMLLLFALSPAFPQKKKAEYYVDNGDEKLSKKDYSGAIAEYSEALKVNARHAEAYFKRGSARSALGDLEGAIKDFEEAAKLRHNYQEAYFESGLLKYELKDYAGAIKDYTRVLEIKPGDRDAYYNRGLARYYLGDYTGCILDNNKAIELDPKYLNAYYSRSLARYEMKDFAGTISDCEKILELDPANVNAWYKIGLARYNLQEYEASAAAYSHVIRERPDHTVALYNRGLARHYYKDYTGAAEDFGKVLELNSRDGEAYYRRGLARYFLKDYQGSISDYNKALAIFPENEDIKKELSFAAAELKNTQRMAEAENVQMETVTALPQLWAVVVGVSDYKDPKLDLKYADKDAMDFYNFLKSPEGGALPEDHIAVLTNEQATRSNIIKSLNEKFYRAFEEDIVILFIASHGQPDPVGNEVYFLSYDTEKDNLSGTAVSQIDIEKVFQRTKAKKKLWIADACHSGGAGLQVRAADHSAITNKLLSEIANSHQGMAMLTASSSSEYSYEDPRWGNGHGVFTYYLLKGMKGEADKDNNGLVEIRELYEFVYRQVSNDTNGRQHPELKGNFDNKLPVSVNH